MGEAGGGGILRGYLLSLLFKVGRGGGGVLRGCLLSLLFGVLFYPREGREGGYFTWDKRCITFLFFVLCCAILPGEGGGEGGSGFLIFWHI